MLTEVVLVLAYLTLMLLLLAALRLLGEHTGEQIPLVNQMMTSVAIPLIYIALLVVGGLVAFLLPRGPIGGR